MSTTLTLILILLFIQCFTPKPLLALVINITDTNTLNERVIQSTIYADDTILLRLVNRTTNGCSDNIVKLKLIHKDGIFQDLIIPNNIPADNFCTNINNSLNQEVDVEGGITLDGIRIYALQPRLILLTYFCKIEQATKVAEMCGLLINWNNEIKQEISFGQTCTNSAIIVQNLINNGGEFLRTCFLSNQIFWTRYSVGSNAQIINIQNSIIKDVSQFAPKLRNLFPTGGGGYGIIYYTSDQLRLHFIPSLSSTGSSNSVYVSGPFQLYKPTQPILTLNIFKCGVSYAGFGYNCLIILIGPNNDNTFVNIDFLDSGSIVTTNEFPLPNIPPVIKVESLYYGGYAILTQDASTMVVNGSIVSNNGTLFGSWGMPLSMNGVGLVYTGSFGVFTNNTIWSVAISGGLKLITNDDLLTNYFPSANGDESKQKILKNFGNIFIESVSPTNGSSILTTGSSRPSISTISVTFTNLIELSNGNVSIWQSSDGGNKQDILRQSFSGPKFVQIQNDLKTVNIIVLNSTFNIPGAEYYVKIDNGFVKDLRTGQGLLGNKANSWSLRTEISDQDIGAGAVSSIIRLTPAGTKSFLRNGKKKDFINEMALELAKIIPIDPTRLSAPNHFQFDPNTLEDQILFRMDVKANDGSLAGVDNSIISSRIIKDLDVLIKNKDFTGVSKSNSSTMLDGTFGSLETPNLLKYRWILVGVFGGALLLLLLFYAASRSGEKKGRNYVIFVFTIISVDIVLDILFISVHGRDLKWIYPTSIVFLTFPIIINLIFTFIIISNENRDRKFRKWWRHNSKTGLLFALLSGIDIDALTILGSGCAGYNRFNAPISDNSFKMIIMASALVKFLEDVPQLIVYVLYQINTVVPAIIPILALSSCCVVIAVKSTVVIRFCIFKHPSSHYHSNRKKNEFIAMEKYDPNDETEPPNSKLFTVSKGESTPESGHFVTTENGTPKFYIRDPKEYQEPPLKNTPSQGKKVAQSIITVGEDDDKAGDGKSIGGRSERKSGTAVIESTEDPIIGGSTSYEETSAGHEYKDIEPTEPMEIIETGGDQGYQSRLIEQIDVEPEGTTQPPPPLLPSPPPPQEPPPSPTTSSIKNVFRSIGSIGGGSKGKSSQDSKKGKSKEDDDKEQEKKDDD